MFFDIVNSFCRNFLYNYYLTYCIYNEILYNMYFRGNFMKKDYELIKLQYNSEVVGIRLVGSDDKSEIMTVYKGKVYTLDKLKKEIEYLRSFFSSDINKRMDVLGYPYGGSDECLKNFYMELDKKLKKENKTHLLTTKSEFLETEPSEYIPINFKENDYYLLYDVFDDLMINIFYRKNLFSRNGCDVALKFRRLVENFLKEYGVLETNSKEDDFSKLYNSIDRIEVAR